MNAAQLLRTHGRSFWWASWLLDQATRERCARLYGLCRSLDDWADREPNALALSRLSNVRATLAAGALPAELVGFLSPSEITQHADNLQELIDGLLSDLKTPVALADQAELLVYAERVAGSVGEMMARSLGAADPQAIRPARDLGLAMQLTNIARDVHEDAVQGRVYLPANWLPAGLKCAALATPSADVAAALKPVLERLLALAAQYYQSGRNGLPFLPSRARRAIGVAARLYEAIGPAALRGLEHGRYGQRALVSAPHKVLLLLRELS